MPHKHRESGERISVVVAGLGFGGLSFCKSFLKSAKKLKNHSVELIVINDRDSVSYTPLLPLLSGGAVRPSSVAVSIPQLAEKYGFRFINSRVRKFNLYEHRVETDLGSVSFDYLLISLGSSENYFGIPGADKNTHPLRTVADARFILSEKEDLLTRSGEIQAGKTNLDASFTIIGGGLSGVETAMNLAHSLNSVGHHNNVHEKDICIIEAAQRLLPKETVPVSELTREKLSAAGVRIVTGAKVMALEGNVIHLEGGRTIISGEIIWTAGVKPNSQNMGLPDQSIDRKSGRILVDDYLHLRELEEVFAFGDSAFVLDKYGRTLPENGVEHVHHRNNIKKKIKKLLRTGKNYRRQFAFRDFGHTITFGRDGIYVNPSGSILIGFAARIAFYLISLLELFTWANKESVTADMFLRLRPHRGTQ